MGELYTYNATHLTIVREGSVEFTQMAQFGQVGRGRFALDDEAGTKAIVGHKDFSYTESSCSVPLTFRGFISDTEYGRDSGIERKPHVGASRGIGVSVVDVNAMLGFRLCYKQSGLTNALAGKRPAETVAARIAWLLASPFVAFADNGRVTSVTTKSMGAADYRYQFPGDVLADCALAAGGFNYHVNDWGSGPELTFRDDNASTADSSTLRISNVYADATAVTLHPFRDATLSRRSDRVKSKLAYNYAKGTIVAERAATATTFNGERGGTASNSNVKSSSKATDDADEMLWQLHTEEDVIECTLLVTSAQVNLILPGQRIEAKFSHLSQEGYSSFTWFRILERTVTPIVADAGLYHLRVKLSPQEAAPPAASLAQSAFAELAEGGGTVTLPNPVTIGNLLVYAGSDRGVASPIAPSTSASGPRFGAGAWTRLPNSTAASTWGDGVVIWYKIADSTERIGTIGSTNTRAGVYEIAGGTIAGAVTDYQHEGIPALGMDMGSLGTVAAGAVAIMILNWADKKHNSDPSYPIATPSTGWVTDYFGPSYYGGVIQWNRPLSIHCHALGDGSTLSTLITRSALLHLEGSWAAAVLVVQPA